jgi:hypothetical protein
MKNTPMDYDELQKPTATNILHWRGQVLWRRAQQVVWFHDLIDKVKV